jgi:hypothetical protein
MQIKEMRIKKIVPAIFRAGALVSLSLGLFGVVSAQTKATSFRGTVEELLVLDSARAIEKERVAAAEKAKEKDKDKEKDKEKDKAREAGIMGISERPKDNKSALDALKIAPTTKPIPVPLPEDLLVVSAITGTKTADTSDISATISVNGRSRRMRLKEDFDSWKLTSIDAGCVILSGGDAKKQIVKRVCVDDPAPIRQMENPMPFANAIPVPGMQGAQPLPSPVFAGPPPQPRRIAADSTTGFEVRP